MLHFSKAVNVLLSQVQVTSRVRAKKNRKIKDRMTTEYRLQLFALTWLGVFMQYQYT